MSDEEKQAAFGRQSQGALVPNVSPNHNETAHMSELEKHGNFVLTEEEAFAHAHNHPEDTTPIYIVYSADDKDNPRNWPRQIQEEFGVSQELTTLLLALYVLGFAVGPVVLAPLSEYFGRRPLYVVSWFVLFMFQLPIALAPNYGTLVVCRFIGGFAGGAPLTNTGGTISDLFKRDENGVIMAFYGVSSTFGPPSALVISGYLAQNEGWRMVFWTLFAITGGFWVLLVLTVPETRHSKILEKKTRRVRKHMEKEGLAVAKYIREADADERRGMMGLFKVSLTRPFTFLFTEPITMFAAAYNGFLYGLVYLFNESFPLVFGAGGHDFNTGEQGLSFLGLAIGPLIAFCFYPLQERYYLRRVTENDGKGVPEARVWMARYGALLIPISLFWFAWTSYPSVHWIVPIIASSLFGAGIYIVILSILNYLVDAYQVYSASALAGTILVRNLVGGGFPMFATQMYKKLGNEWASSLLGFIAILLVPIPWVLFYRGYVIRKRSPWASMHLDQDEDVPH
ncbi:uncharacterized protein N0V89_001959 [Didymosphaeria variabile]|uniref:Major facilitator superfamily (MFS) profile domain-containing protein n=1 Tax=Didymosphaeria variabile TaxID=1932322 RepID=A0A9W9CE36_9PLEO|nr:uncharacterized protein N0V89_001959 [Didymosphaeria variabile]KAJ4357384.1 hypothetical protein N0V89_001959 [Didymosphaeria variabile]